MWAPMIGFVLSTANRLYVGWFGLLMFPLLSVAIIAYITAFILAPAVFIVYPIVNRIPFRC